MGKINVASYALALGAIGQFLLIGHLLNRVFLGSYSCHCLGHG